MDWPAIYKMIDTAVLTELAPDNSNAALRLLPSGRRNWTKHFDRARFKPWKLVFMMTPVLVINGKPVHQGCVPDASQTRNWIEAAYAHIRQEKRPHIETIIEVLGPGCKKCDTLYDNVLIAIEDFSGGGDVQSKNEPT